MVQLFVRLSIFMLALSVPGNVKQQSVCVSVFSVLFPIVNVVIINWQCSDTQSLQCFDAVGWAAGRASGL